MADDPKTYTQEEIEQLVSERLEAEVAGLKANNAEAIAESRKLKKELRDAANRLAEMEQAQKAEKAGVTSDQLAKMRDEIRTAMEAEFLPYRERAEALSRENRSLKLDSHVKNIMAKSGAKAERIDALFRLTADAFDLTEDGQPVVKEHMGTPIDKYVVDVVRKDFPEWFEGSGSTGGGAARSGAVAGAARVVPAGDNAAFMANLEGIAKGTVKVQGT